MAIQNAGATSHRSTVSKEISRWQWIAALASPPPHDQRRFGQLLIATGRCIFLETRNGDQENLALARAVFDYGCLPSAPLMDGREVSIHAA